MRQLDFETSNYKHKDDIKTFANSLNDLFDKCVKSFDNADADLKKVNANIEKKNNTISKLETSLADMTKKTDELKALKDLSSEEIKALDAKKGEIAFTDSEVQKMELEDINAQIAAKKGKISKIDSKIDATKAKIKSSTEEKKNCYKELKELDKRKRAEEEALYRTQSIVTLINETKEMVNSKLIDIVNSPYRPEVTEVVSEPVVEVVEEEVTPAPVEEIPVVEEDNSLDEILKTSEFKLDIPVDVEIPEIDEIDDAEEVVPVIEDIKEEISPDFGIAEEELSVLDYADAALAELDAEAKIPTPEVSKVEVKEEPEIVEEPSAPESESESDTELESIFKREGLNFDHLTPVVKAQMKANKEVVIQNMEILKKYNIPLEYTQDQPEIYYEISTQDLSDLLSIITTDDEGNGMGFTIDYTYNILTELSKINVDKLIDVYNSEFMNVNAKTGIIHLLRLTNPSLKGFEKNKNTNIEILKTLGATTADKIAEKYPDFVNMDNPLFISVLNVFDKDDLVEKLNSDVDVVPKIIDYWKNN